MVEEEGAPSPEADLSLEGLGQRVEQRALSFSLPLFKREEIEELRKGIKERGVNLEAIKREKLSLDTYERYEKQLNMICEALGWQKKDFFDLVNEMIVLPGGGIGVEGEEEIERIRAKIVAREQPLKTAGKDWKKFASSEKNYVYRALGALQALYDLLYLARVVEDQDLFREANRVISLKMALQILRGEQKEKGTAGALRESGCDLGQVRPLPKGSLKKIMETLLSKKEEKTEGLRQKVVLEV